MGAPLTRLMGLWLSTAVVACASAEPVPVPPSSESPLVGGAMPAFKRPTVTGDTVDTEALKGKVVVVKFFAKYCAPCRQSMPYLQNWSQTNRDVVVLGISLDEDLQDAMDQVAEYRLTFPVIFDRGRVLGGRFRVHEMPVSFVADKDGTLVWVGGPEQGHGAFGQAAQAVR